MRESQLLTADHKGKTPSESLEVAQGESLLNLTPVEALGMMKQSELHEHCFLIDSNYIKFMKVGVFCGLGTLPTSVETLFNAEQSALTSRIVDKSIEKVADAIAHNQPACSI